MLAVAFAEGPPRPSVVPAGGETLETTVRLGDPSSPAGPERGPQNSITMLKTA